MTALIQPTVKSINGCKVKAKVTSDNKTTEHSVENGDMEFPPITMHSGNPKVTIEFEYVAENATNEQGNIDRGTGEEKS